MIAGIAVVLLGLTALWFGRDLQVGTLTAPGPGLWPLVIAVLLVATGVVITRTTGAEPFTRGSVLVLVGAGSLAAHALLVEHVGFELPTVVLLALWMRFLGGESWRTTALVSVLATLGAYLVFITALRVPVPHLIGY